MSRTRSVRVGDAVRIDNPASPWHGMAAVVAQVLPANASHERRAVVRVPSDAYQPVVAVRFLRVAE